MAEHKMQVINGIRYRPEDVPKGHAETEPKGKRRRGTGPRSTSAAGSAAAGGTATGGSADPGGSTDPGQGTLSPSDDDPAGGDGGTAQS
ncbi:hypothetical protein [Pseudonocardia sp. WMMC193]|uniref:hypothetical protein n=1 Tax=Pseudonocardia sp. WMMC193 TaxID=2911965 RepID=UPI001F2A0195|nr:hypothetical protein [Pseudonocardia sp. WMMC193]MCF7550976.1 hypothetical protein [Pseudonocardia sp. WMMC193]